VNDTPGLPVTAAVVAAVGALTAATVWGLAREGSGLLILDVTTGVAACALLPALLRWPVPGALALAMLAAVSPAATPAATMATLYVAQRRSFAVAAAVGGAGVVTHAIRGLWRPVESLPYIWWLVIVVAVEGALVGWGQLSQARRALLESLRERARRAEAEQARSVAEARAAERARIAREMHDVLAHRLSLLSVHAGALEFHPDAPAEEVAEAAGVIRETAKTALEELRGVIGVLREDGSESLTQPPQPTLADLAALVEESRAAGMRVTARIELGDAAPPADLGRTAYRIAQEGLTNARKHAPGAAVTLTVRAPDGDLQVEVCSLAPVAVAAAAPLPGTGTGLIGLAERVSLAGGTLEHGVDPDGAFVLRARLPP